MADEVAFGWIIQQLFLARSKGAYLCKHFLASILALLASKLHFLRWKMGVSWPMPSLIILSITLSRGGQSKIPPIGGTRPSLQLAHAWQKALNRASSQRTYAVWDSPGKCMAWFCWTMTIASCALVLSGLISA